jgi:hypothetical protein
MAGFEIFQKGLSLTLKNRMDVDSKFIHQVQVDQCGGKARAAKDQQVSARLLFLFGNSIVDVFGDQFCIFPGNFLQRFLDNGFGDVFNPACKGDFVAAAGGISGCGGPVIYKKLVGHASENRSVHG